MNFRARSSAGALLAAFLLATTFPGTAGAAIFGKKKEKKEDDYLAGRKLTPAQNALIDKAIVREKEVIKVVKERAPLVETYIQNMRPDPELLQVPESDQHFLARVDFGKVINDDLYKQNKGNFAAKKGKFDFFKNSLGALGSISSSLHLTFHEAGFVQPARRGRARLRHRARALLHIRRIHAQGKSDRRAGTGPGRGEDHRPAIGRHTAASRCGLTEA